ncbi:hypothetical protein J8273_5597 [Carpediemonas membranifera]|uniref:Uncharacterized protein n=1 Tax=Carpediemonas membranifera TaxID=201153 RepID=A0A8J6B501_9EUKA|nr:hypothetical protein J8273_5597 [Carpediemonas membranifera]|eukprot:KAG9393002.1 hypothetical protein J8273_5597 [Carpediemonas membranifera]
MLVMVFIVGSYMSPSSMTSCTPVVRNKMEIYTIKASINQAFRQNYTEERRVGITPQQNISTHACWPGSRLNAMRSAGNSPYMTPTSTTDCSLMYAAVIRVRPTRPSCRRSTLCRCGGETTTRDLVAQLEGRAESHGVSPSLRKWFTRYANSVKLWLARTVTTYRDRLQSTLARLEEALAGVGSPAFFQQELAGVHAILNMVNPEILACLPSLFWATHMGENDGLPVSQAAPRILSCVWAIADGVETLSGLISHFNGEYSMSLRQPRLVPIVPMAPVRPGFMAYGETMGLLNDNFCHRVGINPTLPHATRRLLSLSTDGVCVAVTVKRGGRYRPQHDASMPVRKRAKWREKERPRLGTNNAEAPPAPDPDAHLMGFDPGARSIGGYSITSGTPMAPPAPASFQSADTLRRQVSALI